MQKLHAKDYEVVEFTRCNREVTRPALAANLGLSLPTVSVLVRRLLDAGFLAEDGYLKSSGGRRARVLTVNPELATAVGVSVSMWGVRSVLANIVGTTLAEAEEQWIGPLSREKVLKSISAAVSAVLPAEGRLAGVGVGISGLVRRDDGVSVRFPHVEDWADVPLAAILREEFATRVFIDNDVDAATIAELRSGKGRGLSNFLYLYVGKGIGLGIVIGGKVYRGASGNAGELGHVALGAEGVLCHCGNYGCLETVAGPEAIVAEVTQALASGALSAVEVVDGGVSMSAVFKAADSGDRLCENVVAKAAEHIGRMVGNMANLFDPEMVILGGLLARAPRRIMETIGRVFESRLLASIAATVKLEVSDLGDVASALGAADVVFENHMSALKMR